jgi:hypothetical protein
LRTWTEEEKREFERVRAEVEDRERQRRIRELFRRVVGQPGELTKE